jgi:hypothetical protein
MRITMSERLLCDQIRQLENLDPATTVEEVSHNIIRYFRRLAEHIQNYGVTLLGADYQVNGSVSTMGAVLNRSYSDDDVLTRINGIRMLNPLSVSVERNDLQAFVTEQIALVALYDAWDSYAHELQRLAVNEVRAAIERIAPKVLFAPAPQPTNQFEAMQHEDGYQMFLSRAGKRDPMAHHNAVEEYRRQEEAAVKAAREKQLEEQFGSK